MPEVKPSEIENFASIKVVGIGGAGGAAVNRMKEAKIKGVEFIAMNTDAQALVKSKADRTLHLGQQITGGLGAGANPKVGEAAAEESRMEIRESLDGADMVFVAIGAGGGTGSGAGYIVAQEAKKQGILTVGVATRPFNFEGSKRKVNADVAIDKLRREVDTMITIPNDRLLQTIDPRTPIQETFRIADDVLRQGVQGISELITEHGDINLDFADVQAIMKNAGSALMGIGKASGDGRATLAAQAAIASPLIEVSIEGARGVLFNVAGADVSMNEVQEAAEVITGSVAPDANIIFGTVTRPELGDEISITVIATGFDGDEFDRPAESFEGESPRGPGVTITEEKSIEAVDATGRTESVEVSHSVHLPDPEASAAIPPAASTGEQDFLHNNQPAAPWDQQEGATPSEDNDIADYPAALRARLKKRKD